MPREDDILFWDEEDSTTTSNSDIALDIDEEEEQSKENTESSDDKTSTNDSEEEQIAASETTEEEDEDIDLESLFAELEDANKAVDKIETTPENNEDIWMLKDSLSKMEWIIKRLSNEKADLMYKNAELEAFGWDWTDPKILLLSRNLSKANEWDEKSKTKAISVLKDMLYNLTWEDFDNDKINKDIDLISAVESYNSKTNPNLKSSKPEDEDWMAL